MVWLGEGEQEFVWGEREQGGEDEAVRVVLNRTGTSGRPHGLGRVGQRSVRALHPLLIRQANNECWDP